MLKVFHKYIRIIILVYKITKPLGLISQWSETQLFDYFIALPELRLEGVCLLLALRPEAMWCQPRKMMRMKYM